MTVAMATRVPLTTGLPKRTLPLTVIPGQISTGSSSISVLRAIHRIARGLERNLRSLLSEDVQHVPQHDSVVKLLNRWSNASTPVRVAEGRRVGSLILDELDAVMR